MILFEIALLPFLLLGVAACWHAAFAGDTGKATTPRFLPPGTRARAFARRHLALPSLSAAAWIWLNGTGLTLPLYDRMLHVAQWPATATPPSATIVLLGGGTELTGPRGAPRPQGDAIEKIALTARLYHQASAARAPTGKETGSATVRVIVSGGNPQHHGVTEADNYAPDLIALGVPAASILRERRSLNTYQNAKFVRALLPDTRDDPIVLVTTAQHMQRALLYFKRFGFSALPVTPPPYPPRYSWLPTARGLDRAGGAVHELIGIAQFHVYHALHIY
ncbi:YdcF family protein [Robbsia sp. Bb-Pol-6]|uniref:YdcF family protein n=1 Tax=Robbsia betulipollinis TaxID=2981849 RepID=A0ABT3ZKE0_9BURK|nr:YdcF family protein [Robbsia betulipollinis]MCY0386420.1 YdcF family protein [Robbsia betulipollinis]